VVWRHWGVSMSFVVIKLVSPLTFICGQFLMVGTLTMNHMTITKMYTLEHDDILDVEKSIDTITSLPTESALKRVLRIGTSPSNPPALSHRG